MTKKYVMDLTSEELIKVYHANKKLQYDIQSDMEETEMFYISEQLDYLRDSLSDWSIGAYNRNYIDVDNYDEFIANLEEMNNSIPVFTDDETKRLKEVVKLRDEYRSTNVYSDEFDELVDEFEEEAKSISDMLVRRFDRILEGCSDTQNQIDYFVDFYVDSRLDANNTYIIEENGDYILHEDVSYTKSYE